MCQGWNSQMFFPNNFKVFAFYEESAVIFMIFIFNFDDYICIFMVIYIFQHDVSVRTYQEANP